MIDPLTDFFVVMGAASTLMALLGVAYELYRTALMWRLERRLRRPIGDRR
ncbi:MAG: hypothetical protein ACYC5O_00685 [Anaerolineae bacterium]